MITPVHLWRKIPLLGRFPLVTFETNEQRAMRMDEAAKIKARWDALSGLMSPELRPAAPPEPLRMQIDESPATPKRAEQ